MNGWAEMKSMTTAARRENWAKMKEGKRPEAAVRASHFMTVL
jgi:hypothetical protein